MVFQVVDRAYITDNEDEWSEVEGEAHFMAVLCRGELTEN